jgi:hypothetical protein
MVTYCQGSKNKQIYTQVACKRPAYVMQFPCVATSGTVPCINELLDSGSENEKITTTWSFEDNSGTRVTHEDNSGTRVTHEDNSGTRVTHEDSDYKDLKL